MATTFSVNSAPDHHGHSWNVTGVLVKDAVHIVRTQYPAGSNYRLAHGEVILFYYCGCCSAEGRQVLAAITEVVKLAQAAGATKVVLRKGKRVPAEVFCGLPIEDVEDHVGDLGDIRIYSNR